MSGFLYWEVADWSNSLRRYALTLIGGPVIWRT